MVQHTEIATFLVWSTTNNWYDVVQPLMPHTTISAQTVRRLSKMMRHSPLTLSVIVVIIASSVTSSSYAFVRPSSTLITIGRRSFAREGGAVASRQPRDLLPVDLRLEKAYALSGTLRWERRWDVLRWDRRSTLTSDEEMASTSEDDESSSSGVGGGDGGPPMNVPEFPEMKSNGIYEIINADQHK